eukprot:NODE_387_length_8274_cov_0.737125.p6 type:complete len:118 gc:universal NODE_387_length_8274_cov_0.737125:7209-6856(-)
MWTKPPSLAPMCFLSNIPVTRVEFITLTLLSSVSVVANLAKVESTSPSLPLLLFFFFALIVHILSSTLPLPSPLILFSDIFFKMVVIICFPVQSLIGFKIAGASIFILVLGSNIPAK